MARAVTVIPPTIQPITHPGAKRRGAPAGSGLMPVSPPPAREQLTSCEAQVDLTTRFIQSKPEWEFVRVYTDEGISAVNTKKRRASTKWCGMRSMGKSTSS
ncbi:MAG: hypothetical protein ACLU38_08925 [Dysosmobacter sp.]